MSNWITYSPITGHGNSTVTLTAQTLSELEDRVATMVGYNVSYAISASTEITQKAEPPTALTFDSLSVVWVTDIPASGGTATKSNCNYKVYANYSDGSQVDVTNFAEVTGSLNVGATTAETREDVGELELTATFEGKSATTSVDVYQEPNGIINIEIQNLKWVNDINYTGGTASSANCTYSVVLNYKNGDTETLDTPVLGTKTVQSTSSLTRQDVGDLVLETSYAGYSTSSTTRAYQEAYYETASNSTYLSFQALGNGKIYWTRDLGSENRTIYYSINNGEWNAIVSDYYTPPSLSVNNGDIIRFKGTNDRYGNGYEYEGSSFAPTVNCYIFGNILSLKYGDNFSNITDDVAVYNAYNSLFLNVSVIYANHLILPSIEVGGYAYKNMFKGCTSLKKAPELPATTLSEYCYRGIFNSCAKLTTAPLLPVTSLVPYCYESMFFGCTSLNYIKCLATDISSANCTRYWVGGVAETGTFVKDANMSSWGTGGNGIPSGWTVQNA